MTQDESIKEINRRIPDWLKPLVGLLLMPILLVTGVALFPLILGYCFYCFLFNEDQP